MDKLQNVVIKSHHGINLVGVRYLEIIFAKGQQRSLLILKILLDMTLVDWHIGYILIGFSPRDSSSRFLYDGSETAPPMILRYT